MPIDFERLDRAVYGRAKPQKLDFEKLDKVVYGEEEEYPDLRTRIRRRLGVPEWFDIQELGYNIVKDIPPMVTGLPMFQQAPEAGIQLAKQTAEKVAQEAIREVEKESLIGPKPKEPWYKGKTMERLGEIPFLGVLPRTITAPKETWYEHPLPSGLEALALVAPLVAGLRGVRAKPKPHIEPEIRVPGITEKVVPEPTAIPEGVIERILGIEKRPLKEEPSIGKLQRQQAELLEKAKEVKAKPSTLEEPMTEKPAKAEVEPTPTIPPEHRPVPLTREEARYLSGELPKSVIAKRGKFKAGDTPNPIAEALLISRGIRKAPELAKTISEKKAKMREDFTFATEAEGKVTAPTYTERDLLTGKVMRKGKITPKGIKYEVSPELEGLAEGRYTSAVKLKGGKKFYPSYSEHGLFMARIGGKDVVLDKRRVAEIHDITKHPELKSFWRAAQEGGAKETIRPEETFKAGIPFFKTKQERFAQALKIAKLKKGIETEKGSPMITMELKPKDAQTLFQRPSHKYGAVPNELGELEANYGEAAAKAQQVLMFTERDIRRDQGIGRAELADILRKTSRKNRKKYQSDIVEGLENPIELTETKNIPGDVKQVIRELKAKSNRERQEIIRIKRKEIQPYFKRLAEKQYRAERGLKGKRLNEAQRGEINAQAEELVKVEIPDEWGIKDYYRHLHLGEYVLLRKVEGKSEYIGSAQNWTEAVNKVVENYAENPEAGMNYEVNLRKFVDPDVVRVSRRRQYKILNDLRNELNAESTERIQTILRGKIGAREAQRKWAGFMQRRKGLPGYSKDFEFVLNYHNNQFQRWKHLYRLKGEIQPLINQIRKEGRTLVADEIETNLKTLWGQKTKGSRMLDNWLEKAGRGRVRPFALERWTGRLRNLTTTLMLKTSIRYNLLNSMQIMQTGMVVPYKNLVWAQKAVRSPVGKALLDQHGVYHIIKGTAGEITRMYTPVKVRASMVSRTLRLSPETANQAEMWLAVYKHGKDALKMTDAQAADYAFLRGMVYSQFLPLKVNYPRALRSPVVRVGPGMYRTFTIGALELASDLARGVIKKGLPLKQRVSNVGRLSHFVGANMALGGIRVVTGPFAKIFGGGYLTLKIYNQIKDEYGEKVANLIHWGLPSLINSDWSLSVQLIDLPFAENVPEAIGEVALGPMGGTALRIGTQTLSNYGEEDSRLMRGLRAGMQKFGGTRQLLGLEKVLTGDYDFKSPNGKLRFKGDLKDALVQMYGSRPLKSSIQSMNFDALAEVWGERNDAINSAVRLMNTILEKQKALSVSDKKKIMERTNEFNAKWPELAICYGDIKRRASGQDKLKELDAFQRALKQRGKTYYRLFGKTP